MLSNVKFKPATAMTLINAHIATYSIAASTRQTTFVTTATHAQLVWPDAAKS